MKFPSYGQRDEFAKAYENASLKVDKVPPGQYPVIINVAKVTISRKGNEMAFWEMEVTNGPYIGQKITKYQILTTGEGYRRVGQDILRCNPHTSLTLDSIRTDLANCEGTLLSVEVKESDTTDSDFRIINFIT